MGYHLLRNQYRNVLDQSVTVGIVCSALWHVYYIIVYIIIFFSFIIISVKSCF